MNKNNKTIELVQTAFFTAVVAVLTIIIAIPTGVGYINLSDIIIVLIAFALPIKRSMFIASVGCCIADFYLGFLSYSLFTIVIKAIMVYVAYHLYKNKKNYIGAFIFAEIIMLLGYGITDVILTSKYEYFIISITNNMIQAVFSIIAGCLLYNAFKKYIDRDSVYGTK